MAREAKTMAKLSLNPDIILTSPLVRAKQTAEIVAKELGMRNRLIEDERLGLDFGPTRLATLLKDHANHKTIMLVGHEPSMSQTIAHLIGGAKIDFKKGSLACLNLHDPSLLRAELVWLLPPKVLARK